MEWRALQSPEEIPDYIAWKHFFFSVDWQYRLGAGFYYGFINLRLKLGPLFDGNREVGESVSQALADRATLACGEEERFESEGAADHLEVGRLPRKFDRGHPRFGFGQVQEAVERVFSGDSACRKQRLQAFAFFHPC